jgi:hypothetical protein
MKRETVRTSLDIPVQLHRQVHEVAGQLRCSARELILRSIERIVQENQPKPRQRLKLPIVKTGGGPIGPFTNDEAIFGLASDDEANPS